MEQVTIFVNCTIMNTKNNLILWVLKVFIMLLEEMKDYLNKLLMLCYNLNKKFFL